MPELANKGSDRLAQNIAGILENHARTSKRYVAAREAVAAQEAVEQFEGVLSYNEARSAWNRLRQVPRRALTPDLLNRIEAAYTANGEFGAQWAFGPTTVADEARRTVEGARAASAAPSATTDEGR